MASVVENRHDVVPAVLRPHPAHGRQPELGLGDEIVEKMRSRAAEIVRIASGRRSRSGPPGSLPRDLAPSSRLVLPRSGAFHLRNGEDLQREHARPREQARSAVDLFVELAVTHSCEETKIMLIRERGVPAIEIDLSGVARDAVPEVVSEAVLQAAPRRWLYHPGIDAADAKYRADEELRQADLERRREDALAKHRSRVIAAASSYRQAVMDVARMQVNVPRLKELKAVGLDKNVGIEIAGYACFSAPPSVWQAKILAEVFHDRCLGNEALKAIPIIGHLEKEGLVRPAFRRVYRELAEDVAVIEPTFAPPWKAVEGYLEYLANERVLVSHGYSFTLKARLPSSGRR